MSYSNGRAFYLLSLFVILLFGLLFLQTFNVPPSCIIYQPKLDDVIDKDNLSRPRFSTPFIKVKVENSKNPNSSRQRSTSCLEPILKRVRKCLLTELSNAKDFYSSFTPAIEICCSFLMKTLPVKTLYNRDDYKYVILPVDNTVTECNALTVGIGDDIRAEQKLQELMPNCTFLGADPIYDAGKVYSKIGRYIQTGVGDGNGSVHASVLINESYVESEIMSTDFYHILNLTSSNVVDFFFLDAEGAEYDIMPMMQTSRLKPNYTICQLSVEIHGMGGKYNETDSEFRVKMTDLISNGTILPISGTRAGFNRMFWVDFESPACVNKYFANFCEYA